MRKFLLVTTLVFSIFLSASVFAQDEAPTAPTNQLYLPIISASTEDVVGDTGILQTFIPNPETLTLDPVGELDAASACSSPLPPGKVIWKVSDPKGAGYSVLPENSDTLTWAAGSEQDVDGIYRSPWLGCKAWKIPDHCAVTVYTDASISYCCDPNPILIGLYGVAREVNTCLGEAEGWPDHPLNFGSGPAFYDRCASENQRCAYTSGLINVAYGANGQFNYRYGISRSIMCNNGKFGDPIPGFVKACYTSPSNNNGGPRGFARCASENQRCAFSGTKTVAYGAYGQFNYRSGITGGIDCNNGAFGDPISGVVKSCYSITVSNSGPSGYTRCAGENQRCTFSGTKTVAYGSSGQFNYRSGITGGIDCNNGAFGDPISGVVKSCYIK